MCLAAAVCGSGNSPSLLMYMVMRCFLSSTVTKRIWRCSGLVSKRRRRADNVPVLISSDTATTSGSWCIFFASRGSCSRWIMPHSRTRSGRSIWSRNHTSIGTSWSGKLALPSRTNVGLPPLCTRFAPASLSWLSDAFVTPDGSKINVVSRVAFMVFAGEDKVTLLENTSFTSVPSSFLFNLLLKRERDAPPENATLYCRIPPLLPPTNNDDRDGDFDNIFLFLCFCFCFFCCLL